MAFLSVSNNFYRSSLFFSFGPVDKIVIDTILYYFLLFYVASLHQIIHYLKDKIGVVYFRCCVIFDTL